MDAVFWLRYGPEASVKAPMNGIDWSALSLAKLLSGEDLHVHVVGRGRGVERIGGHASFIGVKSDCEVDYIRGSLDALPDADILQCFTHGYYMFLGRKKSKVIQHLHITHVPLFWSHLYAEGNRAGENVLLSEHLGDMAYWSRLENHGLDAAIACSDFVRRNASLGFDFPVEVVYNQLDLNEVGGPEYVKDDYILFVGALVPAKGVDTLVEVAKILEERGCKTPIHVVGSSRLWNFNCDKEVLERFSEVGNIRFLGPKPHGDVLGCMRKARVGVVPSAFKEPFSFVAAEFQACGTPVVASRVGGLPEVVEDGVSGFLVPSDSPESFAEGILRLLKDEGLARKMGEAGRKRVEKRFSARAAKKKYLNLYSRVMEK